MNELDDIKARAAERRPGKLKNYEFRAYAGWAGRWQEAEEDLDLAIAIAEELSRWQVGHRALHGPCIAEQQRDEARAEVEHLKEVLASEYTVVHAEIANAEKARDAALQLRDVMRQLRYGALTQVMADTEWLEEHR